MYQHYKNKKQYLIHCFATNESDDIDMVVYSCIDNPDHYFVRPKSEFFEVFEDGTRRFEPSPVCQFFKEFQDF